MVAYVIALAAVVIVGRWLLVMRRRAAEEALPPSPGDIVQPGLLRTVALLTGPNFDEDEGDDPQSMGEPLARALQRGLVARGYNVDDPCESSHGFELEVRRDGAVLTVSCGLLGGAEDEDAMEWLVFVLRPAKSRFDYSPAENTPNARKLVETLRDVIEAMPGLKRVRWCENDDAFSRGKEEWHERPF